MARTARVVAANYPHHITQRGNRRQQTFFAEEDYQVYISILSEWSKRYGVEIWAYCLMPNHVHLIAVPQDSDGLRQAIGQTHLRYTRYINFQKGWRGYLWQGRFGSYLMDERHLLSAARYIEMNPVAAKIVNQPEDYLWSSARAHLNGRDDNLVRVAPLLQMIGNWREYLMQQPLEQEVKKILAHERNGKPLGDQEFIVKMGCILGRDLTTKRPGPKPKSLVN